MDITIMNQAIADIEQDMSNLKESLLLLKAILDRDMGTNIMNQEIARKTLEACEIRF
jgi:hypothetical protein